MGRARPARARRERQAGRGRPGAAGTAGGGGARRRRGRQPSDRAVRPRHHRRTARHQVDGQHVYWETPYLRRPREGRKRRGDDRLARAADEPHPGHRARAGGAHLAARRRTTAGRVLIFRTNREWSPRIARQHPNEVAVDVDHVYWTVLNGQPGVWRRPGLIFRGTLFAATSTAHGVSRSPIHSVLADDNQVRRQLKVGGTSQLVATMSSGLYHLRPTRRASTGPTRRPARCGGTRRQTARPSW